VTATTLPSCLLKEIAELLDIPASYYEKASDRYRALGDWLHREGSKVAAFDPEVYLQGSFRYGTVNRPLLATEEYDLDLVCELSVTKSTLTQKQLKLLLGAEVKGYAERYAIEAPLVERNRCWRLDYADDVSFHIDILPCAPEDQRVVQAVIGLGVQPHLAQASVAITDRRHPRYAEISANWPMSNPRGLGAWFEEQARPLGHIRAQRLVEQKLYASIDAVPPYEWKTPLQRSIQVLKRHRDVMFRDSPGFAPISMIITTLAAKAYQGELDLYDALKGIVDRMERHVHSQHPRIPNPVNPGEDFTDRWRSDARYEDNFWLWLRTVKVDVAKLPEFLRSDRLAENVRKQFRVDLTADQVKRLQPATARPTVPSVVKASPAMHIASAPKPWRCDA
jgi:hypothetical protein